MSALSTAPSLGGEDSFELQAEKKKEVPPKEFTRARWEREFSLSHSPGKERKKEEILGSRSSSGMKESYRSNGRTFFFSLSLTQEVSSPSAVHYVCC